MINTSPEVSVVIPVYNGAALLERALDSVYAQHYTDYEVIVVDDGSIDNTHEIAARYLSRQGMRGRCIRQPNKKVAAARNVGMQASAGAYIALLDHDDLWYPDKLQVVMRAFERHPEADLICHNEHILRGGRIVRTSHNGPASGGRLYEQLLFSGNVLCVSSVVFKKIKALAIGGFREDAQFDTVEDYDFWMRLSRVAQFRFLEDVLAAYYVVDGSASRRIEYLHANLEHLLQDHFSTYFGERAGLLAHWRMRRRLSVVYRSAATQLMRYHEQPDKQREYVMRMLRTYPFTARNLVRAALWAANLPSAVRGE